MGSAKRSATQSLNSPKNESSKAMAKISVKDSIDGAVKDLGKAAVKKETPRQHAASKDQESVPDPISDMKPNPKNKLTGDQRNEESVNEVPMPHHLQDTVHAIKGPTPPESQAPLSDDLTGSVACIGGNLCGKRFPALSAMFLHLESGSCCSGIDRHALSNVVQSAVHGSVTSSTNIQQSSLDSLQNCSDITGSLIEGQNDIQDTVSSDHCTPPSPNHPSPRPDNLPLLYGGTRCILHDYALESHSTCPLCQLTFDSSLTSEQDLI